MLAPPGVGAVDRYVVLRFVSTIPGARAGRAGPVEPAEPGDPRVDLLVRRLTARQWRDSSAAARAPASAPASAPSSPSKPRPMRAPTLLPSSTASSSERLLRCIAEISPSGSL